MHLLIVSGFLGSGKTTLIVKLAEAAVGRGLKTAVLVNEIGEMGVDDKMMRQLDLNVYQLTGGCLCCTLASDMPQTLQKLVENYSPHVVIIEPSGVAELNKVQAALEYYRGEAFESRLSIVLLDPLRITILFKALTPLISSQINAADLIILNKIDMATPKEISDSRAIVLQVSPNKLVFELSARDKLPPAVLQEILP